jgi:3-phenylpropionate/cinnamic acid dioxygenase small subunit
MDVDASASVQRPSYESICRLLFHEARLLDEQQWAQWASLFAPDGEYWMPASEPASDPRREVSLVYERDLLRALRVKRYQDPSALSLQSQARTSRLVGNVLIDHFDPHAGTCQVSARFSAMQFRRNEKLLFAGRYEYVLVPAASGTYAIRLKKVVLVDCDGPQGDIVHYL